MAVINAKVLELRDVRRFGGVVAGLERIEVNAAVDQPRAILPSLTHLSLSDSSTPTVPEKKPPVGGYLGKVRAGRLERSAGVLANERLARNAGRTILSRWSLAVLAACSANPWQPNAPTVLEPVMANRAFSGFASAFVKAAALRRPAHAGGDVTTQRDGRPKQATCLRATGTRMAGTKGM
jgi:hypothetical protein